jgi:hypothetical protein
MMKKTTRRKAKQGIDEAETSKKRKGSPIVGPEI